MRKDLTLVAGAFIAGCLLEGFAWTTPLSEPIASACIVLGLVLSIVSFISFILVLKRNQQAKRNKLS